jgi:hypothetical protein
LSCSDTEAPVITPGDEDEEEIIFKRGEHSIVFTAYEPLSDRPVTIHCYIPTIGDITEMPVLFSMHGSERDGTIQRDAWKYFAEKFGFIVLAPEFSKTYYKENDYQFGGVYTDNDFTILNEKEKWTYQIIESIFDYFKKNTKNKSHIYDMFGHSAGGQFAHRFLLAMPEARVSKIVAANPGSWTFPYKDGIVGTDGVTYGWPYAIKDTPFESDNHLKKFLTKTLYVQLGTTDTDVNDSSLPKDAPSNAQGAHRYARGKFFFSESQRIATEMGVRCKFQLAEVNNVGHSTLRMVYGKSGSFDPENVTDVGENCAFNLIYK